MKLIETVQEFPKKHILVIGDLILDEYLFGKINRINPEAPVPVLNVSNNNREHRLGGAANTANNVASLGAKCTVIGQVGNDPFKEQMNELFKQANINPFLIERNDFTTIKKTRLVAQNQQALRVDFEDPKPIESEHVKQIINFIKSNQFDMILLSDYNKGTLTNELVEAIKNLNIPIVVDPKPINMKLFKDTFAIAPNIKEAKEITNSNSQPEELSKLIADEYNTHVIITQGPNGTSSYNKDTNEYNHLPTKAREVYDVSGAGDTFIAALTLALASRAELYESTQIANQAAGVVVGKFGTATLTLEELKSSFNGKHSKVKTREELLQIVKKLKSEGNKIVTTNGIYDILHVGHTQLLNTAKSFGDILILAINTDASTKRYKGPKRPINTESERAELAANLSAVDYVVLFDEDTPKELLNEIQPNIHVKGGDYKESDLPESKIVQKYGGEIKIVKLVEGKSSTNTITKIMETQNE
jgi:D-beta-D-heptose 7-phosphate kinase / D-beta-D-heptose 1-phosphate adenosyltransferase